MSRLELALWAVDFIIAGIGWAVGGGSAALFCFLVGGILVCWAISKEDKTQGDASPRWKKWHRYVLGAFIAVLIFVSGLFGVRRITRDSVTTTATTSHTSSNSPPGPNPVPEPQAEAAAPKQQPKEDGDQRGQTQSTPTIQQDCGGGNCAVSSGQQGGITAGQITINTYNITRAGVTVGWLKPAHRATPPSPDPDCPIADGIKNGAILVYFGNMVGWSSHYPLVLVSVQGRDLLTVDRDKQGHLLFSGVVFNEHDDAVVAIKKNKFTASDEAFEVEESSDHSSLAVTVKHLDETVLDIEYLNAHTLRISGHFRYSGADITVNKSGTMMSHGNSGFGTKTGCFVESEVLFAL